jgi:hypothetical protein
MKNRIKSRSSTPRFFHGSHIRISHVSADASALYIPVDATVAVLSPKTRGRQRGSIQLWFIAGSTHRCSRNHSPFLFQEFLIDNLRLMFASFFNLLSPPPLLLLLAVHVIARNVTISNDTPRYDITGNILPIR